MSAPPPAEPAPTGTVVVDAGAIVSPATFASRAAVAPAAAPAAAAGAKPAAGKPVDGAAPVAVEVEGHKRNPVTPEMRKMVDEVDMEKGLSSAEAAERAWPNGARWRTTARARAAAARHASPAPPPRARPQA
jgi:hypothetical protein